MTTPPRRDPVDDAIDVLHDPGFELSEDHEQRTLDRAADAWSRDTTTRRTRSPKRTWAMAAALLIAIGGISFTASGALPRLVRWLRVELDGRAFDVPLDENGRGSTTVDTDHGRSRIDVQRDEFPGGDRTTMQVRTNGQLDPLGVFAENTEDVIERLGPDASERDRIVVGPPQREMAPPPRLEPRDLARGTRLDAWIDTTGHAHDLVRMPTSDDAPSALYRLTHDPETDRSTVRFLGHLAFGLPADAQTDVTRPDDETLRIAFTDAVGSSWIYTFRIGARTIQADSVSRIVTPNSIDDEETENDR